MFTFFDATKPTTPATTAPTTIKNTIVPVVGEGGTLLSAWSRVSPNINSSHAIDIPTISAATKTGPAIDNRRLQMNPVQLGSLSSAVADVLPLLPMSAVAMPDTPPSDAM